MYYVIVIPVIHNNENYQTTINESHINLLIAAGAIYISSLSYSTPLSGYHRKEDFPHMRHLMSLEGGGARRRRPRSASRSATRSASRSRSPSTKASLSSPRSDTVGFIFAHLFIIILYVFFIFSVLYFEIIIMCS